MFAFKLIQLIETRAEPLSDGLMRRIKKDERCAELLRRVPQDELRRRSHEIYFNLNDWLRNKTVSEIEDNYIGLGMRRAKQGVPYTDLLWAVSATKEHLWEFMEAEGIFTEPFDMLGGMDLLHSLDRFFDRILYFAAVGYQNAQQLEQARHGSPQSSSSFGVSSTLRSRPFVEHRHHFAAVLSVLGRCPMAVRRS